MFRRICGGPWKFFSAIPGFSGAFLRVSRTFSVVFGSFRGVPGDLWALQGVSGGSRGDSDGYLEVSGTIQEYYKGPGVSGCLRESHEVSRDFRRPLGRFILLYTPEIPVVPLIYILLNALKFLRLLQKENLKRL